MKKLVVLIVIVVAGLVGYNYYTTGEISLKLPSSLSKEVRELKRLEKVFHKAQNKFFQGSRSASVAGLDSPADLVEAMSEIEKVEKTLVDLYNSKTSESEKMKVEGLLNEIREFKRAHR